LSKHQILILNKIASLGIKRLPTDDYEVGSEITAPDAILVRSAKMHEMEIPASVQAIGRAGAGTNNIPIAEMSKRGVVVFNTPGANANAVKELVLTGMLMAARNIGPARTYVGDYRSWRHRRHGSGYSAQAGYEGTGLRPGNHGRCSLATFFRC
jgi:D-3-phosphoglycerate dehydrogenase